MVEVPQRNIFFVVISAILVIVLAAALQWPRALDHDVSYYASVGKLVSKGMPLYSEYLEVGPPGPVIIGQISYYFSQLMQLPFDIVHKYLVFGLQAAIFIASLIILRPVMARLATSSATMLALGLGITLLLVTEDFGRRDLVGPSLMVPWALTLLISWRGFPKTGWLDFPVGIAAGLAMMMKPHFALLALSIGIVDLVRTRGNIFRLLRQTWIAFFTCILSYALFLYMYPFYVSDIVSFGFETFGRMQADLSFVVGALLNKKIIGLGGLAGLGALVFLFLSEDRRWFWPILFMAILCLASAIALYFVQSFGMLYHQLPVLIIAYLAIFSLLTWAAGPSRHFLMRAGAWTICAGFVLYGCNLALKSPGREDILRNPLLTLMQPVGPEESVLILSTSVVPAGQIYPFLDANWSSVSLVHWPAVALIYQNGEYAIDNPPEESTRQELAETWRKAMAERLRSHPPKIVAVDVSTRIRFFRKDGFDLLAWLRENEEYNDAWERANLSDSGEVVELNNGFRKFRIYKGNAGNP